MQTRFLSDITTLRDRARRHMERGAVTETYGSDRETVLRLLDAALATEIVCVLRYTHHKYMAKGVRAEIVATEFQEHADEERQHADQIAARIVQLGGVPDLAPDGLTSRSHSEYVEAGSLREMLEENLFAERIAIESYQEMIRYIGDGDPTTRRLLESILAVEEEHADDLASLLGGSGP
jgi:bacterioferritin